MTSTLTDSLYDCEPSLKANEVDRYILFCEEIFTFHSDGDYDVVLPARFVEYFEDMGKLIDVHLSHLRPGGYLVTTLPNLRYGQKVLRLISGEASVDESHNEKVMDADL